jgi:hypothetical protein
MQIWTTSCQPSLENPYGNSTCEGDVEGLAAIATLSTGPVGFADLVGFTNTSLLALATRADSVILSPSLPAVNLEFFYGAGLPGSAGSAARIASSPSFIGRTSSFDADTYAYPLPSTTDAFMWLNVFGTFVAADVTIAPVDLWPSLPLSDPNIDAHYVSVFSQRGACVDMRPVADSCASSFTGGLSSALMTINTGQSSHELYTVAPVFSLNASGGSGLGFSTGWAMLGELGKFTRVSPYRVRTVEPGCATIAPQPNGSGPSLCVQLVGASGETVRDLAFVDPAATLRLLDVQLDDSGAAAVVCTCAASDTSSACSCTTDTAV